MVISELKNKAAGILTESGNKNAGFEAMHFVSYVLGMSQSELILNAGKAVTKAQENAVYDLVKRRTCGEPFQYILGTQEFMSLEFAVSPDVLIPRQDTETLVELVLEKSGDSPKSVLDIGTGTGCIPISLTHFKNSFTCLGLDISDKAVEIAKKNSENAGVSDRVRFEKCNILTDFPKETFDIVVSNPPYIKSDIIPTLQSEVKDFDPHIALDGGRDGLKFYNRICEIAPEILKKDGLLAFEIGYDQGSAVRSIMENGFYGIELKKDLSGNDRVLYGYLK